MQSRNIASVDEILDKLNLHRDVEDEYDVDVVLQALDELESIELVERNVNLCDDTVLFGARHGLKWSEFYQIDDPLKKKHSPDVSRESKDVLCSSEHPVR